MHFLLDANIPRAAIEAIRSAGHECTHVRDTPLANATDAEIATFVRRERLTLITRDFDFSDIRHYPPEQFSGIVVLSIPETATAPMIANLVTALMRQPDCVAALPGRLAIVEFGRLRLRPPP